jgi:hypothetical protein
MANGIFTYGAYDMTAGGDFEWTIMSEGAQCIPEKLGQMEKRTITVKLEVFQQDYDTNRSYITAAREALGIQNQILTFATPGNEGQPYIQIPCVVVSHTLPENAADTSGTFDQLVTITFEYELDITVNDTGYGAEATIYLGALFTPSNSPSGSTPTQLGQVRTVNQGYHSTRYDEMRSFRSRSAGTATLVGCLSAASNIEKGVALDNRRQTLLAKKQALDLALKGTSNSSNAAAAVRDGLLSYMNTDGTFFSRVVRVTDFRCDIDQAVNEINWTLSVDWTDFPNEATYAAAEVHITRSEDREAGEKIIRLTGKIGAPNPTVANSKLSYLMSAVLLNASTSDNDVLWKTLPAYKSSTNPRYINTDDTATSNGGATLPPTAGGLLGGTDGNGNQLTASVFLELDFNIEWRKKSTNLISWTLNINCDPDTASGLTRITYSGTVVASGPTPDSAYSAAAAQAATLGAKKYQFVMKKDLIRKDRDVDANAGGIQEFVECSYSYEYKVKGPIIYMEMTTKTVTPTFGENALAVSGYIVAPDYGTAQSTYQTQVRALYGNNLIQNEETDNLQDVIQLAAGWSPPGGTGFATMSIRFNFSLAVWLPKPVGNAVFTYRIAIDPDYVSLKKSTQISGTYYGSQNDITASAAYAIGNPLDLFLTTISGALGLGPVLRESRKQAILTTDGAHNDIFKMAIEFSAEFLSAITNPAQLILMCSLEETISYSGTRWSEFALPDPGTGVSIPQNTGVRMGSRTISGSCVAATEAAAMIFVRSALALPFPSGSGGGPAPANRYLNPPQIASGFEFLPLTQGVARAAGKNAVFVKKTFTFSELLPLYPFNP